MVLDFTSGSHSQTGSLTGEDSFTRVPYAPPDVEPPPRTFPERIDVNALGGGGDPTWNAIATLGAVPGRTQELPFAMANTLTKMGGEKGLIDQLAAMVSPEGGIPFLNVIGHAGRFLNDLTETGPKVAGGIINSRDVAHFRESRGQTDSFVIPGTNPYDPTGLLGFLSGPRAVAALGGRTRGELKANMQARGFTNQDFADIEVGRKSDFDYGDKLISTNPIVELGGRLLLDPTNLFLLAGPVGIAGKLGQGFKLATKGVGLYSRLVDAGVATREALSPIVAARAFRTGQTAAMTVKGFGEYLLSPLDRLPAIPRFFLDPRGYASVRGYTARSIGLGIGLTAADLTTEEIERRLPAGSSLSGIVDSIHGLADDILNDRPLSRNSAFVMISAFQFPARAVAGEAKRAFVLRKDVAAGGGAIPEMGRLLAPPGTKNGGGWLLGKLGSREEAQYLIDHLDRNIAFDHLDPAEAGVLRDIDAPIDRYSRLSESLDEIVARWRAERDPRISNVARVKEFRRWFGEQGNFKKTDVRLTWDPELAIDHWANTWRPRIGPVAEMFNARGKALLKLQTEVTKEHLSDLRGFFREIKGPDGMVAVKDIRGALLRYPGLVLRDRDYWAKFGPEDARGVSYGALAKKLTAMEADAPKAAEVFHESAAVEAKAPKGPPMDQGDSEFEALRAQFLNDPTYRFSPPPRLAHLLKPADSVVRREILDREKLWASILYDGPLSPISRLLMWARSPVSGKETRVAAEQAVYNFALPMGASAEKVKRLLNTLDERANEDTIFAQRVHFYRGPTSLPANKINMLAEKTLGDKVYGQIHDKYGGFDVLLDRASNRAVRALHTLGRQGGKTGRLARVLESGWVGFAKSDTGHASRLVSKTFYHIFRFILDPRWHMMNKYEAAFLARAKYGTSSRREGDVSIATLTHQLGRAPTAKQGKALVLELSDAAMGATDFLASRQLGAVVGRAFDRQRVDSGVDVLNALERNDKALVALRRHFGVDDNRTLAEMLDEQMYQFDTAGVKATIASEADKIARASLFDEKEMAPFLQKIYERNQQVWNDVVGTFYGNANRSNIERIMNSYWLYWPISYQLKAGKWLFDVMTKQFGGRKTNFGGAWTWQKLYDHHLEMMKTNPDYAQIFEDNQDLWFAAQMIVPITPADLGVSLSRPLRYAGGALGVWGDYEQASNPLSFISAIASLGPIYTSDLLVRLGRTLFSPVPEEEPVLPEFRKESNSPNLLLGGSEPPAGRLI